MFSDEPPFDDEEMHSHRPQLGGIFLFGFLVGFMFAALAGRLVQ